MPLAPITPPPGVIKPGTLYDARGRWYDTLWVRWFEGVMQAIGGFDNFELNGAQIDHGEAVSGTHAWRDNDGNPCLAFGGPTKVQILRTGTLTDVTPASGFTAGAANASNQSGQYGNGSYGEGLYGTGDESVETTVEAQSYQMDNFGEDLVFVSKASGKLYYVDIDGNGGEPAQATVITESAGTAPVNNQGVVVTPEFMLMGLGTDNNPREIRWSDQGDETDWAATNTNQAGDLLLPGRGAIMAGRRSQNETLVWTETDLFSIRYVGGSFVYTAVPVGAVGAISRRSMAIVGSTAFWMGPRGFYQYDGYTKSLPSPLADFVFRDMNQIQKSLIWAEVRAEFGEVTWHYPSGSSDLCDRTVTYNYEEGFWYNNTVSRTGGEDRGALTSPVAFGIATAAVGTLTATANFANTETVVIGSKTYTFQATLTDSDGNVHIGSDLAGSLSNLAAAIALNNDGESSTSAGTDYAASMTEHSDVKVQSFTNTTLVVEAKAPGSDQNDLATTETASNASWGAVTLEDGEGALLFRHETGTDHGGDTPTAISGPVEIGQGDRVMRITSLIPDERTLGEVDLYLLTAFYPSSSRSGVPANQGAADGFEVENGPYTPSNPTDVRLTARQARLKVVESVPGWRIGTIRADLRPGGRR